jgi:hypothetical protein
MRRQARSILMMSTLLIAGYAPMMAQGMTQPNASATTKAEHKTLALRDEQEARLAQGKADEYRKMLEWYEKPGNGNYATVKGGFIHQLNYLIQKATEESLALVARHRQQAAVASNRESR